jgi:hypothetical protein
MLPTELFTAVGNRAQMHGRIHREKLVTRQWLPNNSLWPFVSPQLFHSLGPWKSTEITQIRVVRSANVVFTNVAHVYKML